MADAPSHDVSRLLARWKDGDEAALQELLPVMSHAVFSIIGWALCLAALIRAQDSPRPQATFRTGVDLIQVDVSVLDPDRRPIRGLGAADFTLLEDGQPRPIVSFTAVDVPAPVGAPAAWNAHGAPDVATNTHRNGRTVVLAIDDGSLTTNGALWGIQKTRAAARAALAQPITTILTYISCSPICALRLETTHFACEWGGRS